jgi:hypothetical protein
MQLYFARRRRQVLKKKTVTCAPWQPCVAFQASFFLEFFPPEFDDCLVARIRG